MPNLRHILFPYDFSEQGRQTARFVRALAQKTSARVTLFSAVPPTFDVVPLEMDPWLRKGDDMAAWHRNLQSRLNDALVDELAGLAVERVADRGDPAFRIADFAEHHQVDLIMMPTHGLGTFRNFLVGSVTSKVLHDTKCPVWTAAHSETQAASDLPRVIVCSIDGSAATTRIAQWAAGFAEAVGARLSFLHVVASVSDWPSLESARRLQEEMRDDARATITSLLKAAGLEAPLRVAVGAIVQTAADAAAREQAELMVIGRGSIGEPFGRLRTHVGGIVNRSPCPVLSV